jgi:hypothetical protein
VIENRICEGTDCLKATLSSGVTSLQVIIASARSVGWGSNEAVTLLFIVPWPSALMCSMETQVLEKLLIHISDQNLH